MYNRYIPQPDGSYRRNYVPDQQAAPPPAPPCPPPRQEKPQNGHQPQNAHGAGCHPPAKTPAPPPKKVPGKSPAHAPANSFLRQLLPAEFDTGDLMIVLLLLLMAGDSPNDRNHALLTLALYFFL